MSVSTMQKEQKAKKAAHRENEQSQWAGHDMDNGEGNRDEGPTNEESQGIAHEMDNAKSSEEVRSIEDIPNEVLEIIIDFSLTGREPEKHCGHVQHFKHDKQAI